MQEHDRSTDLKLPQCPRCGVYLIIGFVTGGYVAELKRRFGWRIARYDQGVSKQDADAVVTGCVVHKCPRCGRGLDDFLLARR